MSDTIMAEEIKPETKVAFMAKPYSREDKIKQEEEELEQLLKAQRGETEEVEVKEEEPTSAEEKTFKKRYGDLRRHTQEKEKEFQTQIDDLKRQLKAASEKEIKLPRSEKELEEWASEYPDVAAIVETIAIKKAKEQAAALEERMKKVDELEYTAKKEKAEAELLRLHPDFAEIRDSDDFHEWAEEQPRWVQDALYENDNDAKSAARAIDLYKVDRGFSKKKSSNNDAARSVETKTSRSRPQEDEKSTYLRESQVQKMSAQEYERHSEEIMEAIRSGKFIYDVSGSAR
ncbi:MAG: hypothetical protein VW496_00335 [Pelagibacteraceae bacterium]